MKSGGAGSPHPIIPSPPHHALRYRVGRAGDDLTLWPPPGPLGTTLRLRPDGSTLRTRATSPRRTGYYAVSPPAAEHPQPRRATSTLGFSAGY
jgi:hypothetical protein